MIFIPGNVPSSKNSRQWTGKYLISSKATRQYIKDTGYLWISGKPKFLKMIKGKEKPYKVVLGFVRGTRHKFDYHNACQIVFDLMTECNYIDDDNADEVIPVFEPYQYNKDNPGVYISVL